MALSIALQNLRLLVIGSSMFIVCDPALMGAQCKVGIDGSFSAPNSRPAEPLEV